MSPLLGRHSPDSPNAPGLPRTAGTAVPTSAFPAVYSKPSSRLAKRGLSAHDHAGSHGVVGLLINQHKAACCAVSPIAIEMNRRTGLQRDTGDVV